SARWASATTSVRHAGLVEVSVPPDPLCSLPPMSDATVRLMALPPSLDDRDGLAKLHDLALGHGDPGHHALLRGGDVVLHLHGLQDGHGLARPDLLARLHQDLQDLPLHGGGQDLTAVADVPVGRGGWWAR